MNQKKFITDFNVKDQVETTFLVKYLALNNAKDGKKYINMILTDNSGDLESRIWSDAESVYESIDKGDFVVAKGKINLFQGRKQFIVSSVEKIADSDVDMEDYLSKSTHDPEKMFRELIDIVNRLDDVYIKDLLTLILSDAEIARRLKLWQAGKTIHHAYQSGLIEHILSCARLADSLSDHYQVNKNYVVAGAVLHDLCKIYELTDGLNVDYTEEGKLVGHLVKGLEIVDRFSYKIKGFPYDLKLHLKHILLAHHGEYEYGSPKIPQTSEAYLVHLIDLMDSKMHTLEAIKKADLAPGHWSNFNKSLDRIVFKNDLPHYPEYREDERTASNASSFEKKRVKGTKELKQNLGSLLADFKVDEK